MGCVTVSGEAFAAAALAVAATSLTPARSQEDPRTRRGAQAAHAAPRAALARQGVLPQQPGERVEEAFRRVLALQGHRPGEDVRPSL